MTEDEDIERTLDPDYDRLCKLDEWGKALDSHWGGWIKEAKQAFRIVAGDQYDKDEKSALKDAGKIPVTFNRAGPIIDSVVGAEIQGRQQTQYFPREQGDAKINEILTQSAEWLRDRCDAEGEETDAARDCFICGMGVTNSELDYEEDQEGKYLKRRLKPYSVLPDPNARQSNAIDRRYQRHREQMSRDEFEETFGKEEDGVYDPSSGELPTHNADPREAYDDEDSETGGDDMVTVDYWQWYEVETVVSTLSRDGSRLMEYPRAEYQKLEEIAAKNGDKLEGVTRRRRRYYAATVTGKRWLERPREMPFPKFTYNFKTGKRDEEEGVWYGLVRPMVDPQKWANAFFSMLLHMVRTNAKGGIIAERGAIGDRKDFEETWASSDSVTIVSDGALSQKKVMPKPQPAYPQGIDRLMEHAIEAIQQVSGISPEMLGMADRDQPGILEAQRKQAAYGLLSVFFESFRRYRKEDGELMLHFMRMLGPETLVRVTLSQEAQQDVAQKMGHNGGPPMEPDPNGMEREMYVPLALALDSAKYDVIVDESPAGPNMRERTWLYFMQLLPVVGDRLTPDMWAEALKYSPFPESFSAKMREMIMSAKPGPEQQAMMEAAQQAAMQLDMQGKQLTNRKTQAEAESKEVETAISIMRPDPNPQIVT